MDPQDGRAFVGLAKLIEKNRRVRLQITPPLTPMTFAVVEACNPFIVYQGWGGSVWGGSGGM